MYLSFGSKEHVHCVVLFLLHTPQMRHALGICWQIWKSLRECEVLLPVVFCPKTVNKKLLSYIKYEMFGFDFVCA